MISTATKFAAALLFTFFCISSAQAGPPLICHTFDIGNARSLPWISHDWNLNGNESYDTTHLVADTVAILDADPTVLVHMETLRRAMLYGQKDPVAAKRLLITLMSRANSAGNTAAAAIANFDAGYLAETYKQFEWITKASNDPAHNVDGYALIKKAIQLCGDDPQIEFAAALITMNGPAGEHKDYAQKAIAGSKSDALLARNLSLHFRGPETEIIGEMISKSPTLKVAQQ
jgi:hypothetical protein